MTLFPENAPSLYGSGLSTFELGVSFVEVLCISNGGLHLDLTLELCY